MLVERTLIRRSIWEVKMCKLQTYGYDIDEVVVRNYIGWK